MTNDRKYKKYTLKDPKPAKISVIHGENMGENSEKILPKTPENSQFIHIKKCKNLPTIAQQTARKDQKWVIKNQKRPQ